jgi:hypothetical protein
MSSNRPPPVNRQSINEATEEAQSRALDFDPNVRARFIRQMLNDMSKYMSQGLSEDEIREKAPEFSDRYPELFKKIINKEDLTPIQSMLVMLDKMGEGALSQHNASMIVGQRLVDRFIKPQLNGTSADK